MMSTLGAQELFYLLPVYRLLCLRLSAGALGTPTARLPGRGRAQRRVSAAGLLSPDLLPGLIRTDLRALWAKAEDWRGKNRKRKGNDDMVEEWQKKSKGGKTTTWMVDRGTPPLSLTQHQEESQTQTAFPPKIPLSHPPLLLKTARAVWPIKTSSGNCPLFLEETQRTE